MLPCENAKLSNAVIILHMSLPKRALGDIPRKFERKKERKLKIASMEKQVKDYRL